MIRQGHDNVNFFTGTEVEHTPAFGKQTLFVVGIQSTDDIGANISSGQLVEHIYFGANMSFPKLDINDSTRWSPWEKMIKTFLDYGYFCTLDIDVSCAEGLLESGLCEYPNFIPMVLEIHDFSKKIMIRNYHIIVDSRVIVKKCWGIKMTEFER